MEPQRNAIAEELKRKYTPSFQEQCEQTISEMRSQIRSLENAVEQLQRDRYGDRNESHAPLVVNLDEVAPPPWLRRPKQKLGDAEASRVKHGLKSKLLIRGSDK
jgi:hypothetical protein